MEDFKKNFDVSTHFSELIMLYASHIIQGLRPIEMTPSLLRPDVEWIVNNAVKKGEVEESETSSGQ